MWNVFQFLTSGLLAVISPDASQVEYRSCSYAGVFHVRVSSNYSLTSQQADELCQSLYSSLATEDQIREAYSKGLDTCRYGWINDERMLMLQHELQPDCPSNGTGVMFLADTPESLSDAYCYDASVTLDLDCEEAMAPQSVTPPDTQTTEESTAAVTSNPGPTDSVIEKATTDSSEGDGLETKNPTVQTDTETTPDAIEPIPEVQTPTGDPEDNKEDTTTPSKLIPTDADEVMEAIGVPVEPTTEEPTTVTKEGKEEAGDATTEANSEDSDGTDAAVGTDAATTDAATTSLDDTTTNSDLELPVSEDVDDSFLLVNGTKSADISTTTAPAGTLEPSEVNPSKQDEDEALALSTVSPVEGTTADTDTFTTSESEDTNPDSKEDSTTVVSPDDVPETTTETPADPDDVPETTTETPADPDVDLKEEIPNGNNISYGLPSPRGRMGPKDIESFTAPNPAAQEEGGTPAWLIIFSFVMSVGVLLCVFAAVGTRESWYGPLRQKVRGKDSSEETEKKAAVSLSTDQQQEMVTLMNRGPVQTNGRAEEFTVIALEEPPEKEFLA
ncbi:cell surface glycoprotein 1 [Alosa sapidissima]|uniref:cell surface glycoprotein 1 n=1 Tax=Alosa sapidissima TaxID=34773 RepID=UPI001C092607|nr:cell surface glycoprotein 1 [Alosa sapidissima]XP_041917186.1 cell surface glycoprotein 1 [Alosa sapidissima]XP_041917187.1 cell surface glycoprotein 1 [Alosa sapidissima]